MERPDGNTVKPIRPTAFEEVPAKARLRGVDNMAKAAKYLHYPVNVGARDNDVVSEHLNSIPFVSRNNCSADSEKEYGF
jgi:hypothetical protein